MADLKFGGVTPGTGDIKVGSSNASKIYQGSTLLWPLGVAPQPGEVTVCDLTWTKTNSTITATTTGGNIPIVTNQNDWITKCQNNEAAACYWQFNSNNAFRGLYYNVFTTEVIQPPTGFRLPTQQDWQDLIFCAGTGSPDNNSDVTSLANNYYGFWPSNVVSNSRFGTVDFNSIGAGYTANSSTFSPPPSGIIQGWYSQGIRDVYHQQQPGSLPASYYPVAMFWTGPTSQARDFVTGYWSASINDGFGNGKNFGYSMRFVKDAQLLELYDNDTQTGPTVNSIVEQRLSPVGQSGQYSDVAVDIGSVVVPSGGGDITFFQYLDNSTMPSITDGYFKEGRIRVYYNSSRSGSIAAEVNWTQANQGGTWSPDGSANQKEATVSLPQGTYYLRLGYFGEKPNPPGPAYQVVFNTGVSV
jgi:hypothetical protein